MNRFLVVFCFLIAISFCAAKTRAADLDFAAPSLTIDNYANGAIVNTRKITLSGTTTDAGRGGNGISSVYVSSSGYVQGASTTGNGVVNWSQEITLNKGANYLTVEAYDGSQNQNQASQQITVNFAPVDPLPPTIHVTSHTEGQIVHTTQITLSGTATDAGNGNSGISGVYINGSIPGTTTTGAGVVNWSRAIDLHSGVNYIYIYADDASDVNNEQTLTFTIDFEPLDQLGPNLIIISPANGQTVASSTILVQGTASDAGRGDNGISSVYLSGYLPDTTASGANTVAWSRSYNLFPGANTIGIWAYDASDVKNETYQSITVNFQPADTLAPLLNVTSHTNGQIVFNSRITITGTATDAGQGGNGISAVYLQGKIDNSNTQGTGVVTWNKTIDLTPGPNFISIEADDDSPFPNANRQTLTINFQAADTLGPNLTITSHFDGQVVNIKTITIRGTASDAGRGDDGISSIYLQGKIPDLSTTAGNLLSWSRTIDLNPGQNRITVSAYDAAQFPNGTDQSITIVFNPSDSLAPGLVVTSHTPDQIVFTNVVTVSGTASDAGRGDSGVTFVKVNGTRADGDTATGAGVANWTRTFALTPGNNNISVTASDGAEFPNETNVTLRIVYQLDNLPPALTVDTPRNNATVGTSTVTVSGTASDGGSGDNGIAGVTLNSALIPGSTAAGSSTVNWSQTVNLQRGPNLISIVATDNSPNHNASTATLTVTYEPVDTLPPTITIDSHRNGQIVGTSSITLTGTATDNGSGGSGVSSVTVNGAAADHDTAVGTATANWSKVVNLKVGPNLISVVAQDNSPGQNTASQAITIDYEPNDITGPEIVITSHRKGQTVATPTIVLAGTASDAGLGDSGVSAVTVNTAAATGGTAPGGGIAHWSQQINLSLGLNVISVVARDDSANKNSTAATIQIIYEPVDRTPPDIEVTSHQKGQTVNTPFIVVAGTASDADRGDNGVTVAVNDVVAANGMATGAGLANWSQPLTLNLGENVISIVATDSKQNSSSVTLTLIYDPHGASSAGNFCWARNAGAAGEDDGYAIAVDREGNSYVAGAFEGTAVFDTTNLVSQGQSDIFLAKYDADGILVWARQAGGSGADAALGMTVSTNGNVFVTGYFSKAASFGKLDLSTTGTFDLFLAKFDSDGNILWATNTGRGAGLLGSGVAVDAQENCFVAGSFSGDAFFGDSQFFNNTQYDAFVARFDSFGSIVWATQLGGEADDRSAGIALDPSGRVYVAGYFTADASFQETQLTSSGDTDMFLCQFNPDGQLQWVQQAGEIQDTKGAGLAVDTKGNTYVTGYFNAFAMFGDDELTAAGLYDMFLVKYDSTGKELWARNTETSHALAGAAVALDGDGNAYVAGSFGGNAVFGSVTLTNDNSADIFVAKFDAGGTNLWVRSAGGDDDINAFAIAVTPSGEARITGSSVGVTQFGNNQLTSNATSDIFVTKLSDGASASAPQLTIRLVPSVAAALVELAFFGEACSNYRLQGSTNLIEWSTLLTTNGPNGSVSHRQNGDEHYHFFRVVSP